MFVQQSGANFSWNAYTIETGQINPVSGYSFLRDDNNTGNWHVLVNTVGLSTTDPNYSSYPNANWRIDAIGFSCTPTLKIENIESTYFKAHSNTIKPTTTGINEFPLNNEQITISPNPTTGTFEIMSDKLQLMNVEIYNVLGIRIYLTTHLVNVPTIDISSQPSGIYFLKITDQEGNSAVKKIIRE